MLADLPEHLQRTDAEPPAQAMSTQDMASGFETLRARVHREVLAQLDLQRLHTVPPQVLRGQLQALSQTFIEDNKFTLNEQERRQIIQGIQDEILGLGPIEPFFQDPGISDILVNGPRQVYIERRGRLEITPVRFDDDQHLLRVIHRIVSRVGRRIDETSPMVDARLADGSRVNAVIAPLAMDGPLLSIRRFSQVPLSMDDLLGFHALSPEIAQLLQGLVKSRVNLLVSGGTGSGKTTLLNVMSSCIATHERIITIEDAAELQLQQPHVVRMESRPPNVEGQGEISQRALLVNSLRMRPDRIILGEVRGAEVLDMLQAMNTGHDGSMTTIHANSPRDAITRLEHMLGMAGLRVDSRSMRQQIGAALSVVVQVSRLPDGQRKLTSLQEITGMEGDVVTMQEIFRFEQTGVDPQGTVQGHFAATGIRPKFMQRLKARGIVLRDDLFAPGPLGQGSRS